MQPITTPTAAVARRLAALREHALTFPEAFEDFPWGHVAIKVRSKIFVILVADADGLRVSMKLPESNVAALDRSFAEPTGYGLGKSGWITATFVPDEEPPLELLRAWIAESYRAIAPKKLSAPRADAPLKSKKSPAKRAATPRRASKRAPPRSKP